MTVTLVLVVKIVILYLQEPVMGTLMFYPMRMVDLMRVRGFHTILVHIYIIYDNIMLREDWGLGIRDGEWWMVDGG